MVIKLPLLKQVVENWCAAVNRWKRYKTKEDQIWKSLLKELRPKRACYVFDIGAAYREDVDEVIEVIKQVDEELRSDPDFNKVMMEPIEVLSLNEFSKIYTENISLNRK